MAGQVYGAYKQNEAIKAANNTHPAPFIPVDVAKTAQMALIADKAGYDVSDRDWAGTKGVDGKYSGGRFSTLAQGRDYNINDMAGNLEGKVSPTVTNAMNTAGLPADLGDNPFKQARNLGLPIAAIQNRDRGYFQQLLGDNPQRAFGLSGQDTTRIAVTNTGNQNNFNQGVFQSNLARYNTGIQQNIANNNAAVTGLAGLAGLITQNNDYNQMKDPYLSTSGYSDGGGFYTGHS